MTDHCDGEFIDGTWYGCGCEECAQAEYDAIESDVETGAITEDEALYLHDLNDAL